MKTEKLLFSATLVLYLASIFLSLQPLGDAYYHVINSKDLWGYLFPKECNNFTWMWPPLFHVIGYVSGLVLGNWYVATRLVSLAALAISGLLIQRRTGEWLTALLMVAMPGAWLVGTNSYAESLLLMLLVASATLEGPMAAGALALASLVKHETLLFLPLFWIFNPSLKLFAISLLGQLAFMAWSAFTCGNPLLIYGRTQTLVVNPATIADNLAHGLVAYPMALGALLPIVIFGIAGYRFGREKWKDYLVAGSVLLVVLYEGMTAIGRGTVQGRYLGLLLPAVALLASGWVEKLARKGRWILPALLLLLLGQSLYMAASANREAGVVFEASKLVSGTVIAGCPETIVFADGEYQRYITLEYLKSKIDAEWLKREHVDYVVYCGFEWVDNSNIRDALPGLEKIFEKNVANKGEVAVFRVFPQSG